MQAEIVAIGSELTSGAKLDTNSQWLSLELAELGIPVAYHVTMADSLEAMTQVLETAVDRSDLVLVTGGLGPTLDDLTRHAIAAVAGTELVLDEESLEHIRNLFARRGGKSMPERNEIQAMFPVGSRPIVNPRGSAPGIWIELARGQRSCLLAAMPGVPSEMKRMFTHEIRSLLPAAGRVMRRARINCFGVGESAAEEMLGELTARDHDPEVGITVHEATITMRINAEGDSEAECLEKIARTREQVRERLGTLVFGEDDQRLQDVVVEGLAARGQSVATVEIGTGGVLAAWLSDVPGQDACFVGGRVIASGSPLPDDLAAGLVTPGNTRETAEALAAAARTLYGSDFALSIGECPDYDPDDKNEIAPTTWVACAGPDSVTARSITLLGDVSFTRSRSAKTALDLLRHRLE